MIYGLRKFVAPEIIFGNGARKLAGQYCKNFGITSALLVSDIGISETEWFPELIENLEQQGIEIVTYTAVSPNPRDHEVMAGVTLYQESRCNGIVALGGGSPMDLAKGIGIVATNGKHILDFEGIDKISVPVPPLVFIPTTAGTSADVSQFSIITNVAEKVKIAIISKNIVPDIALIDPETTTTMSPYLTACTGMDALAHGIEAFVSTVSSPITDLHALEGIKLVFATLPAVLSDPQNLTLRYEMMRASMEAGLAFSNAILGAVHAMAHSLGGYLDLPHGECNAILLEHVVDYNFSVVPERFRVIAEAIGMSIKGMSDIILKRRFMEKINVLRHTVGINRKLKGAGVTIGDLGQLSAKAVGDACLLTNPRKATKEDIRVIYEEAL